MLRHEHFLLNGHAYVHIYVRTYICTTALLYIWIHMYVQCIQHTYSHLYRLNIKGLAPDNAANFFIMTGLNPNPNYI